MKKFIIVVCIVIAGLFLWNTAYYQLGIYIDLHPNAPVTTFMKTDETTIYMEKDGEYVPFEIRGVNLGVGIPGEWATDFSIDQETYLRWFEYIQKLGANTIRVYTILHDDFYDAFYEYNTQREEQGEDPLYLLHGVWVNDYILNSHRDAYDDDFLQTMLDDCRTLVDVLHGNMDLSLSYGNKGNGRYHKDVSPWVIGYILGVEWEDTTVVYTNQNRADQNSYSGTYFYTTDDASPFEAMLCQVGDKMTEYESERYKQQRLIAFSNWPTTDPFTYPVVTTSYRQKMACIDVENIQSTSAFISGMFASYHVYSYFPDYLEIMLESEQYTDEEIEEHLGIATRKFWEYRIAQLEYPAIGQYLHESDYTDSYGRLNTYAAYLKALNRYHHIPVVISEYGVTTGRGMAQVDKNTGRNQGHMTEQEQGQALIDCYRDIMDAGCAGSCVFTWQDEWFKRTWNTMHAVDLDNTPYWSDYQTNEQYFGLLAFDPGKEESICYVDGDTSEWTEADIVQENDEGTLFMKYDEKFLYFLIEKKDFHQEEDTLYIPIDLTPKSGSTYCREEDISFERACDFLIKIHGKEDSRVLVQERYEVLLAIYGQEYYAINPYYKEHQPWKDSPSFRPIYLALTVSDILPAIEANEVMGEKYETGKLRYGNANPKDEDFDSLADFIFTEDGGVEIRLPWQLLNFSNPSEMMIHDDYYECYGVENLHIDEMYVGLGSGENSGERIRMEPFALEGWGKTVTYHERLKESYYILKDYWASLDQQSQNR